MLCNLKRECLIAVLVLLPTEGHEGCYGESRPRKGSVSAPKKEKPPKKSRGKKGKGEELHKIIIVGSGGVGMILFPHR